MVAIAITGTWILKLSLKANFLEANYLCKLAAELKEKTMMHEAQVINFKDLSLSSNDHSGLMQF